MKRALHEVEHTQKEFALFSGLVSALFSILANVFFRVFSEIFFRVFSVFCNLCSFFEKKTCAYFVLTTWGKRRRVLLNDVFDLGSVSVVVVVGVGVGHGGHWLLEIFEIPLKLDCSGLCCCRCCCGFLEVRGSHAVRSLYGFLTPSPSLEFYVW